MISALAETPAALPRAAGTAPHRPVFCASANAPTASAAPGTRPPCRPRPARAQRPHALTRLEYILIRRCCGLVVLGRFELEDVQPVPKSKSIGVNPDIIYY